MKHFKEEVEKIKILIEARYTLICLQSAIFIYSMNMKELFDIVSCCKPHISSAISRTHNQKLVLAYLKEATNQETIEVHDYSICARTGMDTIFTINKPFGSGYKIGAVQLDS